MIKMDLSQDEVNIILQRRENRKKANLKIKRVKVAAQFLEWLTEYGIIGYSFSDFAVGYAYNGEDIAEMYIAVARIIDEASRDD